ncbi:GDSL-type esterase/lipase family protein [Enemella evansiae]|uniref:GDSL-type esterase/lipase family protein n=1 Tax=Enemella evansiae TaxID=2016499 RepID=UPI00106199AE|nr:GDSL-type esterase/lipase family protein [Enemella evansiae]
MTPRSAATARAACSVDFAAVGASFTEMGSPTYGSGTYFDQTLPGPGSWAYWTDQDPALQLTGGYAHSGWRTSDLAGVSDLRVQSGSYLVILAGTNNVLRREPFSNVPADLDRIVATSGVPAQRVLISLLPPTDPAPDLIAPFNSLIRSWAANRGVQVISAAEHMDAGDGSFKPGMSTDGVHLTQQEARRLGESVAAHLSAMAGCEPTEFSARADVAGTPTQDARCGLRDGGCAQLRQRGELYRSATTGARLVKGSIATRWRTLGAEGGQLGYPIDDEFCGLRDSGCLSRFQGGLVYWSGGSGAHSVTGLTLDHYARQGWETGLLRYPTAEKECGLRAGGCRQRFQNGAIYWSSGTGTRTVRGLIEQSWVREGGVDGHLGYPTSDEFCGLRDGGCANRFQGATYYWSPATGTAWSRGAIFDRWGAERWEAGWLGYPLHSEYCGLRDGGCFQSFQNGAIYWSPGSGAHFVRGLLRQWWADQGWENGRLGYPTSDEFCDASGCWQDFQGGRLVWRR